MDRRTFLGLVGTVPLAGCTAGALTGTDPGDARTPAAECPAPLTVDRTVCPRSGAGPLAVRRSTAAVDGADWSLRVAVANRSDGAYGCNPFGWSVFRRRADGWGRVAPGAAIEPWTELSPGDRLVWRLSASSTGSDGPGQRVFLDLDPGRYAFAVPFRGPMRVGAVCPFAVRP